MTSPPPPSHETPPRDVTGAPGALPTPPAEQPRGPSNLAVRIGTAFTLGPLLLWLLFGGPLWGWALLIAASAGQVCFELLSMTHPSDRFSRALGGVLTAGLVGVIAKTNGQGPLLLAALLFVSLVMAVLPLARLGEMQSAALRVLGGVAAPVYVGLGLSTLVLLRAFEPSGRSFVFLTLTIAWMGDTGGYTFGRLFGKTKLYEAVSPKKTREGLLGSVVFSGLASGAASMTYLPEIPLVHGVLLGCAGALLGQAGDLVESLLKRSTGVKDSGSILPGHGGLFDRVDALLVVGPLVYLYGILH